MGSGSQAHDGGGCLMAEWTQEECERIVTLRTGGASLADVAESVGRSVASVKNKLYQLGTSRRPVRPPKPVAVVQVPAWVPAFLHSDYIEAAAQSGEHAAAAWARAEKRRVAA